MHLNEFEYKSSSTYIQKLKLLACFFDWFVFDLVGNPDCWFSCVVAQFIFLFFQQSSIHFRYVVTEIAKKSNNKSNGKEKGDKNKEKSKEDEYREAMRDLQISWLSK